MKPIIDLRGTNATLTLFGAETDDDLLALGYHADRTLRAGRIFLDERGKRYRLTASLRAGLYAVGIPGKAALEQPVRLEAA